MSTYEYLNEAQLIDSLKKRDQAAFSYLYDNYAAALYGVIIKIIGREEEANDLLQESFVKIWKSIATYDDSKGRLYTWMLNITRNTAIDLLRSSKFKKSRATDNLEDNTNHIKGNLGNTIKVDNFGVKKIVDALEEKYQKIIELSFFKGYTHEEIAQELSIPLGTVKTRSRSALIQLKNIMK